MLRSVLLLAVAGAEAFQLGSFALRPSSSLSHAPVAAAPTVAVARLGRALPALRMMAADGEEVKSDLLSQLSVGTGLKVAADGDRVAINELLINLEPANPTKDPAMSPLLNGVWDLLYTGGYGGGPVDSPTREIALLLYTGGYKPGLVSNLLSRLPAPLAPLFELDDLSLTIQRGSPRVEASANLRIAGNEQEIRLKSDLTAESGVRLSETYCQAEGFGQTVELAGPFRYKRTLFVTYLDDDLMVARDETGVPDIWVRKTKDFWLDEADKPEGVAVESKEVAIANPEVKTDGSDLEPEWTRGDDEDIGPSDY
uniref:Plastid lipid-associated protein/fibrillin conserved domain-containing protein n=1 Tax=Hemiselmis tepida TaxID=464990 RepID=A0A7S0V885_9CRYP|mmetsp:Transcript_14359/g.36681  ORF Transcript_14359/g.36681 Transcript_14359/m.36681 type:complete len:312 (+) Transcript_14359:69-1004(+)|eukprot:CAMPEP_0174917428 /NCGR_PEP_ID=MMETSP1355-20121228/2442_1 /TAXON_ID=464990 /ORGANISM="Hemiselmis tepida, Strain CCMP443" /LENGTH=311 /DNA_ID=CAMNT_0016162513 /DNA_START=57 /DNA_END=992 /DNA_ORIENTATION=-